MRYLVLLVCLLACVHNVNSQVVFQDDFEAHNLNTDLSDLGYLFSENASYKDVITTTIQGDNTNQYAACVASANGGANMQLLKAVNVTAGKTYKFSLISKSPFKRHLRMYQSNGTTLIKKGEDLTPTEDQETQWIEQEIIVVAGSGVTSIQFGIYHNWSGTLLVDNFLVEEIAVEELPDYYISSSGGDDSNEGTIGSPWKTLEKISLVNLKPGNTVNFKSGDRFDGHFVINGSGTKQEPITITSYGDGEKPIITGEAGEAAGGDYQEAILVENQDNILFDGLEVNNERLNNRTGVDETDAYGIFIHNSGTRILRNFTFRNMTFRNVYAPKPILQGEGENSFNGLEVAAVRFFVEKNTVAGQEKNIQDVLMENCYFTDLQRLGVHIKHGGGAAGVGDEKSNRNMNLVFRNNEFHYTGGTCILPTNTFNCLIEDNLFNHPGSDVDPRMPNRGSSVWTWRCYNTIIQRNQCISTRGYLDSHGIHIDHENHNTFVQYNYMEDCEGGFVEILGGNVNAVYRFNISVNDGWRNNPNWKNSNHTIWINQNAAGNKIHYCEDSYIYNNTVFMDQSYTTAIDVNAKNTFIFNNIFYAGGNASLGGKQVAVNNNGTDLFLSNNLYYGTVANSFKELDAKPVNDDPKFNNVGGDAWNAYQLHENSPAIDAGVVKQGPPVPGAGEGIFINIPEYPTHDFFGNPIDLSSGTPNIGACNTKSDLVTNIEEYPELLKDISYWPNPVNNILHITGLEETTDVKVYNTSGQLLMRGSYVDSLNVAPLSKGVYLLVIKGCKPVKFLKK